MLIIRRLNCIDAASGIVTVSKWPSGAQVHRSGLLPQIVKFHVLKYRISGEKTPRSAVILGNDQLDTHLLYFTILYNNPLHVSSIICSSSGG